MNESNPSDQELAELLSLTMKVGSHGTTTYRNHLGQKHRVHGPAIIYPGGEKRWYQHDRLHREDGPAVIYWDGIQRWLLNGKYLTEEQFNERIKSI